MLFEDLVKELLIELDNKTKLLKKIAELQKENLELRNLVTSLNSQTLGVEIEKIGNRIKQLTGELTRELSDEEKEG